MFAVLSALLLCTRAASAIDAATEAHNHCPSGDTLTRDLRSDLPDGYPPHATKPPARANPCNGFVPTCKPGSLKPASLITLAGDPTGKTDSTCAFEDAIASVTPGGTLEVPYGTFAICRTIEIKRSITIRGVGWSYPTPLSSGGMPPINHWTNMVDSNWDEWPRDLLALTGPLFGGSVIWSANGTGALHLEGQCDPISVSLDSLMIVGSKGDASIGIQAGRYDPYDGTRPEPLRDPGHCPLRLAGQVDPEVQATGPETSAWGITGSHWRNLMVIAFHTAVRLQDSADNTFSHVYLRESRRGLVLARGARRNHFADVYANQLTGTGITLHPGADLNVISVAEAQGLLNATRRAIPRPHDPSACVDSLPIPDQRSRAIAILILGGELNTIESIHMEGPANILAETLGGRGNTLGQILMQNGAGNGLISTPEIDVCGGEGLKVVNVRSWGTNPRCAEGLFVPWGIFVDSTQAKGTRLIDDDYDGIPQPVGGDASTESWSSRGTHE